MCIPIATVGRMGPEDYWSKVGAPKLRELLTAYKEAARVKVTNSELASQVEMRSGKKAGRAAFEHFINGKREPYISQLVAICDILGADVSEVLQPPTRARQPLIHSALTHTSEQKQGQKKAKRRP